MAKKEILTVDQGATYTLILIYGETETIPYNITGYSARMWLKRDITDTVAALELSTGGHGIVIDGPAGKLTITMSAAQTAALNGMYLYDLEIGTPSSGVVTRLVQGYIKIDPEVTTNA